MERNTHAITCQLDIRGARAYELCVVPHWDPSSAIIERYAEAAAARCRQADVTRRLRAGGWIVIDHVETDRVRAAA